MNEEEMKVKARLQGKIYCSVCRIIHESSEEDGVCVRYISNRLWSLMRKQRPEHLNIYEYEGELSIYFTRNVQDLVEPEKAIMVINLADYCDNRQGEYHCRLEPIKKTYKAKDLLPTINVFEKLIGDVKKLEKDFKAAKASIQKEINSNFEKRGLKLPTAVNRDVYGYISNEWITRYLSELIGWNGDFLDYNEKACLYLRRGFGVRSLVYFDKRDEIRLTKRQFSQLRRMAQLNPQLPLGFLIKKVEEMRR